MPRQYMEMTHRCPRLGGPVSFEYCRYHASEKNPCWKILDCWWESFDVVTWLTKELGEKTVTQLANTRPPPKTESLLTLIQQAQKRCAED